MTSSGICGTIKLRGEDTKTSSIYLDNNATAPLLPDVRDYIRDLVGKTVANPSSPHSLGADARKVVETARGQLASALKANPENLLFVSSGSEANTMALMSARAWASGRRKVVTSPIEHMSVLKSCEFLEKTGFEITLAPVGSDGIIQADFLYDLIDTSTYLVSAQWVNNETGVIQPIKELCKLAHQKGALFHCDAAQALGKVPIGEELCEADFITITGHKIGAPQGVAALYARRLNSIDPLVAGGEQEHGLRGGTENVVGIAGLGLAAILRTESLSASIDLMTACRNTFESIVMNNAPEVQVNGSVQHRVCNTTNLRFPQIDGHALVARLDKEGIFCSQSSACSGNRPEPSHVLTAMGLRRDEAYSSLRFSFGIENSPAQATEAAKKVVRAFRELHELTVVLEH